MADNVPITAGSGTTIATDDVTDAGGAHYQKVKLADGAANSTAMIGGDATNGLDVDVTRVIPGTGATNLGKAEDAGHTTGDVGVMVLGVRNDADASFGADLDYTPVSTDAGGNQNVRARRDLVRIADTSASAELTIVTTTYSIGDQVGVMFQFANAARASGGGGMLVGLTLLDEGNVMAACDVVLFRSNATLAANNAAFSLDDTNSREVLAVVQMSGGWALGNGKWAQALNLAIPYYCSGGTTLYAALITRSANAVFVAHTDLTLTAWVERN